MTSYEQQIESIWAGSPTDQEAKERYDVIISNLTAEMNALEDDGELDEAECEARYGQLSELKLKAERTYWYNRSFYGVWP